MTRKEYKAILLSKGFIYEKSQMGYPGRDEQDVYTHPSYKYKFYITRVHKNNESLYGFLTAKTNGRHLESIYPHNEEDDFDRGKGLFVWTDNAFFELMKRLTL